MLYPNPLSLFCVVLLCFPLALVLTFTSNYTLINPNAITNCKLTLISFPSPPPPPPSPPPPPPPPSPPPPPPPPPPSPPPPTPPPPSPPPPTPPPPSPPPPTLPPPPPSPPPPTLPPPPPLRPITKTSTPSKNNFTSNVNNITQPLIKQLPPSLPPPPPPPPVPKDDKDDVDLLKRASRVNPNPIPGHQKKVAFLFLTTTPLPFVPLWELFFNQSGRGRNKGHYNIYIHADPRFKYNPPFSGVFSDRVIPASKPTHRNTPTLITAARRLLAHALLDDPDNYMFTILSGACIPLHSFNFTYNTLVNSNKSFIEILSNETTAYGRWAARGEHAMLPEVSFEDFRIGSQFWTLTRRHARVVVKDVKLWRKFRLPCVTVYTCYPEENYFPTLLSMVDPQGVVPATLTNVNWVGRHDGHPHTYNASEVDPGLIRWLRDTRPRYGNMEINGSDLSVMDRWDPFLFARKFAPNCVEPLINLAKDVLFKD